MLFVHNRNGGSIMILIFCVLFYLKFNGPNWFWIVNSYLWIFENQFKIWKRNSAYMKEPQV